MLSKRLSMILDLVEPCDTLADVGTDHGYLALEAILSGKAKQVIAADVRQGPLKQAQKTFAQASVFDKVKLVLSDGITSIEDPLDAVVISGMGADLILKIISQDLDKFKKIPQIIVQANTKLHTLRQGMAELGFQMMAESLTQDGFFYLAQRYVYTGLCEALSEEQAFFGVLLDPDDPLVLAYWTNELNRLSIILKNKTDAQLQQRLFDHLKTRLEKRVE